MCRLFLSICLLVCVPGASAEQQLTRIGYAHSQDNDVLLYTEHHHEMFIGDIVVESKVKYNDAAGITFAEKNLDFRRNSFLPEFSLTNASTGHQESTRYLDDAYEVRFTQASDEPSKIKQLEYSSDAVSDAGFDNFIINHWQEIISAKKFTRDFLIPGLLRFIKFRIYQEQVIEQSGQKYRVLHIEPANILFRTIGGTSRLFYDFDKPVLKRFQGISNVRDEKGDNYKVVIHYHAQLPAITVAAE